MATRSSSTRVLRNALKSVTVNEALASASRSEGTDVEANHSRKRKFRCLAIKNQEKQVKLESTPALQSSGKEQTLELGSRSRSRSRAMHTSAKETLASQSESDEHSKENTSLVKDEDDVHMDEGDSVDYMQIRENNLKANQEVLARIGMQQAKEDLEMSVTKKKIMPTQRGLLRQKRIEEPLPRRHSLRLRRIDPDGVPLPEPEPVEEPFVEQRLPEIVSMEERQYFKNENSQDLKPFLSTICSLESEEKIRSLISSDSAEHKKQVSDIQKIKITENQVAKVVPARISSLTWHPSKTHLMAIAGDKNGYVGLWNVLAKDNDESMVKAFQPHINSVTHLFVPPSDSHKLYTSSYDATLRCGDFQKGVFDLVFSVPEENDDLFRNFEFIDDSSMLVSHFRGLVSLVDTRTASTSAEKVFKVSQHSLRKVSVHPVSPHYFITAGRDAKINLWDLRSMKSKSPRPVQTLSSHSKAIASAYFSPISGKQILSCSSDDTIVIHSAFEGMNYKLTTRIRHNNHTGRWLTPFQPSWHPSVEGIFVSGSMARPRQIEVFDSCGKVVKYLAGDYLASVCSLNVFHPTLPSCLVGGNSSGRLHVFK